MKQIMTMPHALIQAVIASLKGLIGHPAMALPMPSTGYKREFVDRLYRAWKAARSPIPFSWIWPQLALESDWGRSALAQDCSNLGGNIDMGTRPCNHYQPAADGGHRYAGFRDYQDYIERYTQKVTHEGNHFYPAWQAGQKVMARDGEIAGALAYWRGLARLGWAGVPDYDRRIASIAGLKTDTMEA